MAELKTKPTRASALAFLKSISDEKRRRDALLLLTLMQEITNEKPRMWGSAIVGFGTYHYESTRSAQKGDWPLIAFSPRKANLTVYLMNGCSSFAKDLAQLGPHKHAKSCLYISSLEKVHVPTLKKIIAASFKEMKRRHARE